MLAISLLAVGLALIEGEGVWTERLRVLVTILLMTLPLASHALARARVIERERARKASSRVPGD
jgi:multisubunit Na+/H+ antiporter MnhG subunit